MVTTSTKFAGHKNDAEDYRRAKELRRELSSAEKILWHELRQAAKTSGIRFRRQHPLHPYIVDFVCLALRLAVEIDGPSHNTRMDYDEKRDEYLRRLGFEVMRFTNEDAMTNCRGVVEAVLDRAEQLLRATTGPLP